MQDCKGRNQKWPCLSYAWGNKGNESAASMLDDLGLLVTMGWLCRGFGEAHSGIPGIPIDRNINIEENEVPAFLKLVIFRILQEALNNVGKHSKASLLRLSLAKASNEIELSISDNGEGFDGNETPRHGLGLASIRERAELSNGSFAMSLLREKGEPFELRGRFERKA